jgi:hypothetical protein
VTKRILITGSGGREHALAWKLSQSPGVEKIFIAPGNAGTSCIGENVAIAAEDVPSLLAFAKVNAIDFTVVGPDDALAAGVVDAFEEAGLRIFGPRQDAARLESSKAFAKDFMIRHGIPTADYREFTDSTAARDYCRSANYPLVVKADGLALGKGVIIAANFSEADAALRLCMEDRAFGDAGSRVVIEEFLTGVECSIHALVDGSAYLLFPIAATIKKPVTATKARIPVAWERSARAARWTMPCANASAPRFLTASSQASKKTTSTSVACSFPASCSQPLARRCSSSTAVGATPRRRCSCGASTRISCRYSKPRHPAPSAGIPLRGMNKPPCA